MATQFVTINGKRLGVWFQHVRDDQDIITSAIDEAITLGQIDVHHQTDSVQADIYAATRCQLEDEARNVVAVGYAFCSANDNFSKQKGRNISLARAVEWAKR